MRRWTFGLLSLAGALAACDKFAVRADVAAEVGDHQLTAERVAEILRTSGGGPTLQAAEFVSNLWLDYSLFAKAVADKDVTRDSTTIARVMWPEIAQARASLWHDSSLTRMTSVSPSAADSAYAAGEARVFQHIITIPTGPTAADTQAAQRTIRETLAKVRSGGDFGALAADVSADGSKADQGYLPVGAKGQFVPAFEDAAWKLEPGQVSEVVNSQFGYHIIRRPTLDEARVRFTRFLAEQTASRNDSLFMARLTAGANVKVAGGAPGAMKAAAFDPDGSRKSSRTLVSMKGGDFTVGDFVRWIGMFPLNAKLQIRNANDSVLTEFAKNLAHQTLLLRQADSAKFDLTEAQWQFVVLKYTNAVSSLRRDLGLDVAELSDSSNLSPDQRAKVASEKIEEYFGKLIQGQAPLQTVLPALASDLRAQQDARVNQAGLSRAVELAAADFRRDSAAAASRPQQPAPAPGIQAAPGGPPIAADSGGQ